MVVNIKTKVFITLIFSLLFISGSNLTANAWQTTVKGEITAPLTSGQNRLFASTDSGIIYAFTFENGSIEWQRKISTTRSGISYDNGVLYVLSEGELLSLNATTGDENWIYEIEENVESEDYYYFPTLDISSEHAYFSLPNGNVYSVNKEDGVLEWIYETQSTEPSAAAASGTLIFVGGGDGKFTCLTTEKNVLWSFSTGANYFTKPVFYKQQVIVGANNGYVYSFDQTTGELRWSYPTGEDSPRFLEIEDDNIVVVSKNGSVVLIDSGGKRKWSYSAPSGFLAQPVISDSYLYVGGNDGKLRVLSLTDKEVSWIYPSKGRFITSPFVVNKDIYFAYVNQEKPESTVAVAPTEGVFVSTSKERGVYFSDFPFGEFILNVIEKSKNIINEETGFAKPINYSAAPLGMIANSLEWKTPTVNLLSRPMLSLAAVSFLTALFCGPIGFVALIIASFIILLGNLVKTSFFGAATTTQTEDLTRKIHREAFLLFKNKISLSYLYFFALLILFLIFSVFSLLNTSSTFLIILFLFICMFLLAIVGSLLKVITINFLRSGDSTLTISFTKKELTKLTAYYLFFFTCFIVFDAFVVLAYKSIVGLIVTFSLLSSFSILFGLADSHILKFDKFGLIGFLKQRFSLVFSQPIAFLSTFVLSAFLITLLSVAGVFLFSNWFGTLVELILLSITFVYINSLVVTLENTNF